MWWWSVFSFFENLTSKKSMKFYGNRLFFSHQPFSLGGQILLIVNDVVVVGNIIIINIIMVSLCCNIVCLVVFLGIENGGELMDNMCCKCGNFKDYLIGFVVSCDESTVPFVPSLLTQR
jgi:hypothetical protein